MAKTMNARFKEVIAPALVLLPFYLNDFFLIGAQSAGEWLWIDYVSRTISLGALLVLAADGRDLLRENRIRNWDIAAMALVAAFLTARVVENFFAPWIREHVGTMVLQGFPGYNHPTQRLLDLTLGIAFVAVSEEVVFRWYLPKVIGAFLKSKITIDVLASVLFALAHWSRLSAGIFPSFVIGLAFALIYRMTGTIWPLIAAHYANDYFEYAG